MTDTPGTINVTHEDVKAAVEAISRMNMRDVVRAGAKAILIERFDSIIESKKKAKTA